MQDRHIRILVVILVTSLVLRLGASLYLGNDVVSLPGTNDQISYHNLALRLLDGHGFSFDRPWWPLTAADAPTAHWSYLYTFFLAAVYSIFGPNPLGVRLIQAALVGFLQPLLMYWIGKRVFNPTVGLIAAGLSAFYFYFVYYAGTLMTEPFYITAILASVFLALKLASRLRDEWQKHYPWGLVVGLGLSLSAAVLLRQLFLLLVPFILLWLWWASRNQGKTRIAPALVVIFAILILVIAPFTVYNYSRFERFVLLNTNAGFAFFWGNHPIYGTHFVPILTPDMGSYQELIPQELRTLDEAALDQALLKRGIEFILKDPGRYVLLSLSRIPPYFMFWPSRDSEMISNFSRVASFGLYLPFMIYGLILAITRLPKSISKALASPEMLLIGFALLYTGIHLLTWVLIRYRLPVDAVLMLFAGLAVYDIAERVGNRLVRREKLELSRQ